MNIYKKYCPNVFVAQCTEQHAKGDIITVTSKYGKENEHIVHNLVWEKDGLKYYSITRADGLNCQERAAQKAEKLAGYATNAVARSNDWVEKASEGKDFLALAEPIKVGHHSEKRHRALFERNNARMQNAFKELEKAESYESRIEYWEKKAQEVNLSMPESLEFFQMQLADAEKYHQALKNGTIEKPHSLALSYAKKRCNDIKNKIEIAQTLWGEQ